MQGVPSGWLCTTLKWAYATLLFLRATVAVVGPGYVHPDEFFQTVEITAGTVFSLQVFTPWEFANVHAPCRSIVPPFLFTGVPLLFLRWLDQLANRYFSVSLLTSKLIFVTPRLFMVVASLTVDCLLHQLSRQELCANGGAHKNAHEASRCRNIIAPIEQACSLV